MSATKVNLDNQAVGKTFAFGDTSASGTATVTINKGTAAASTNVLAVLGSASIAGDLTLTGNLNITGSIDEQTVTNLAVKDLTIRTNKGGTTAGAAGAGLQVEGDSAALIGAITYAAASGTKFQIGDGTTQVDIVGISSTQTLTNKSISGGQISSAVANATLAATSTVTNGIATAGAAVVTSAASAPAGSGYALVTTSATVATWQTVVTTVFKRTTITGTLNGSNTAFTLGNTPVSGSEMITVNGLVMNPGGNDYTLSGTTVTFSVAPQSTDILLAWASY